MWYQLEYWKYFLFMFISLNLNTFNNSTNNCSSIESISRKFDNSFDEFYYLIDDSMSNVSIHACNRINNYRVNYQLICNVSNYWYKHFDTIRHNENNIFRTKDHKNKYSLCFNEQLLINCDKKINLKRRTHVMPLRVGKEICS